MREDMFKVIVERPRGGMRYASRSRNRLSGEHDLPTKIGVKRQIAVMGLRRKHLSENLNPLRRYLGRQIGRPWNDVYSEMATALAPGHTIKEHVRLHIDDFVARKVSIDRNGRWFSPSRRGYDDSPAWRQCFYVDPNDGLLKESRILWDKLGIDPQPWRRRKDKGDPDVRVLDPLREHRRIDGVWYEIVYRHEPDASPRRLVFDLALRAHVPANEPHAIAKRQLSGAELKRFGLANQPVN